MVTLRCTDSTSTRLIFVSETGTNTFTCVWPQTNTSVSNSNLLVHLVSNLVFVSALAWFAVSAIMVSCSVCGKAFKTEALLTEHEKNKHSGQEDTSTIDTRYAALAYTRPTMGAGADVRANKEAAHLASMALHQVEKVRILFDNALFILFKFSPN